MLHTTPLRYPQMLAAPSLDARSSTRMSSQLREIRLQLRQRHGLDVSQPTISHHLKVLRTAGLLDSERRGSWVYYRSLRTHCASCPYF